MKNIIFTLILCLAIGFSLQAQTYIVIVNSSNSTSSLSKKEISSYFLKKKSKWSNGEKVSLVDLGKGSSVRADFSKDVHKKSIGSIKSYWQQYVFAGKGTPPVEKQSDADVIAFVKSNSGAIGYVSANATLSGVKELKFTD